MSLVEILLNGESKRIRMGITVAELVEDLGLIPDQLAIEYNLNIIKKTKWTEIALTQGDQIEIVHFVGGGSWSFETQS